MCGRITYHTNSKPLSVTWCFCVTCQKQSGCAFLPFAEFQLQSVVWDREPDIYNASDIAERYSCRECGSALGMRYHFVPNITYVTVGSINERQRAALEPTAYIFLKDKPAWFNVPTATAGCEEFGEKFTRRISEWRKTKQSM